MKHLVIVEEGLLSFRNRANTISGTANLSALQGMGREVGISFYVTTNTLRQTDVALRSNVYFIAGFRPSNGEDAADLTRVLGLDDEQAADLPSLPQGTVVLRIGRIPYAIRATFPPIDKTVDELAYNAARERTHAFCKAAAREGVPTQPAPVGRRAPSPPPTFATAVANNALLNAAQRAFLLFIIERGICLVIETYDALRLKPMQGHRIQKRLLALGMLTATRIRVGNGRGKEATALTPTAIAYNTLRLAKPHLGRGGPQHAWLLRTLRERIATATIETNGADIAVAYNSNAHANLRDALRSAGHDVSLNDGDAVAIEVELDVTKTARPNLRRNDAFRLTIIAVPKTSVPTAQKIAMSFTNAVVVDVFAFLHALEMT